jgi:hypothetical protein
VFGILLLSLVTYPLHLDLWVDKDDAVYYPTERLKIFFQTEKDCFVAVYNIEPGGRINKLFPQDGVSGWVEAHQVYQLPPKDADYDYVIEGPEGIESIIALASEKRLPALDDKKSDVASRTRPSSGYYRSRPIARSTSPASTRTRSIIMVRRRIPLS